MDLAALNDKIRPIAEKIASSGGFEFVRSEIGGTKRSPVVRIFIDKADGLTVEHCADVSRELEAVLDEKDLIPTKYVLEVSSPGIERELTSLEHFERFKGKLVRIKTSSEVNGQRSFIGTIERVVNGIITLHPAKGEDFEIPFDSIEKANLKIDLNAEFRSRN